MGPREYSGVVDIGYCRRCDPGGVAYLKAPVIGASGSAFRMMGMALVFGHRLGTPEGKSLRDTMIFWAILSTVFGSMGGNVAHGAHFSGLFAGILLP